MCSCTFIYENFKSKFHRPYLLYKRMCLGTFSRHAQALATICIFARVRILGTSVPFYVTGTSYEFPVT